ncbi:MAG: lysylphosphatidylglycerol synthase transmembrane domain-containing protein [Acidimicrobiales bacterium]
MRASAGANAAPVESSGHFEHRAGEPGARVMTGTSRRGAKDSGRVRRPLDLLLALFAVGVVVVTLGLIRALPIGSTEVSDDVSRWLVHIPRWLSLSTSVVATIGSLAFAVVALFALVRHEARSALNAGLAAVLAAAGAIAASAIWHSEHGPLAQAVLHGKNPSTLVVDVAFVAFVVGSDLVRRARWSRWCVLSSTALLLTGLAVDSLTPFALAVALFAALFFGWALRWLFGAASVRPSTEELTAWLRRSRLEIRTLRPSDHGRRARLEGSLADGTPIEVRMANRDTRGAGLARRLWALVRLRPLVAGHVALSSRAQIDQVALSSYLAKGAGVVSPRVLLLGEMPPETLVLALAKPVGEPFGTAQGRDRAVLAFRALRALHDAGVAHRDLRAENLVIAHNSAGFSSLDAALPAAGELVRRLDVTQLLTTLASSIGPAQAVEALRSAYHPADEAAIAATMQPIALAPWGWAAMREAQGTVAEVRHELVGAAATAPIANLERFRWRTVISAIALTFAAFLLIGQLSKVDLLGALRRTNLAWFALALAGSALTYLAAAVNLAAFVPKRLSVVRGFLVQLSTAFVGIAMPATVGHVAVNARYLSRENIDGGSITAAVAMSQIVNVVTTVLLLIVFGLLTGSGISRFHIAPSADLLIGLAVIAVVSAILLLVPETRKSFHRAIWPRLRSVWPRLLDAVSQPVRLGLGILANLLLTFSYLVAFIASLRALGAHPAILPAAVVYLAGNTVGSAAPTPGGLGAVEAVLSAGLTAMGVPAHEAIPSVLIFRIATFWLPIPAGWISYVALHRNGTL